MFTGKPVDAGFLFAWVNRKRPIGRSILISGGDGGDCETRAVLVCGRRIAVLSCFRRGGRYSRQQLSAVLENASAFSYRRDAKQLLSPWADRAAARESAGLSSFHATHRELISGFAMPFRCPMRCNCRSRRTEADTIAVFRRNRRKRSWTFIVLLIPVICGSTCKS